MPSRSTQAAPASSSSPISRRDAFGLLGGGVRVASMLHGNEAQAVPGQRPRPGDRLPAELRLGAEPPLVELLRRERADVRVHAPRLVEEDAAGRVDGRRFAEEVAEGRDVGAGRVDPLDGLVELAGIAEQDEAPRRLANGEGVGEAHLSRLVDDEDVHGAGHLLARPQPRGACGEVRLAGGECLGHLVVGAGQGDAFVGAAVAVVRLLDPADVDRRLPPGSGGRLASGLAVLDRRLVGCVAHGGEQVGDHLVAVGGHPDPSSADEQVEDHPGSGVGLAAARRPLHGEHRAVEPRGDPLDGVQRGFALRSEAIPDAEA